MSRDGMVRALSDAAVLAGFVETDDGPRYRAHLESLDHEDLRSLVTTLVTALHVSSEVSADLIAKVQGDLSPNEFALTGGAIVAMTLARLRDEIDRVAP